jgi:hypothetical protein
MRLSKYNNIMPTLKSITLRKYRMGHHVGMMLRVVTELFGDPITACDYYDIDNRSDLGKMIHDQYASHYVSLRVITYNNYHRRQRVGILMKVVTKIFSTPKEACRYYNIEMDSEMGKKINAMFIYKLLRGE